MNCSTYDLFINQNVLSFCLQGNYKELSLLLKNFNINTLFNNNETLLHIATKIGYRKIIKMLLKYDININIKNIDGFTAIDIAYQNNFINIIKILRKKLK